MLVHCVRDILMEGEREGERMITGKVRKSGKE